MGLFELILGERPDALPLISKLPPDAVWRRVRPRESRPVSAKLATRNGSLRSSRGALHYRAGEHYIVQREGRDNSVVSRATFERAYQQQPDDAYQKRGDIAYRFFVLPRATIISTPEGRQRAAAGDWIMQGVEGELWPIDPHAAAKLYVPVADESAGKDTHARPSPRPHSFSYLVGSIDALAQNNDLGGERDISVGDIMSEVSRRSAASSACRPICDLARDDCAGHDLGCGCADIAALAATRARRAAPVAAAPAAQCALVARRRAKWQ